VEAPDHEPVSRRDRLPRPALSRTSIVEAALEIAEADGLDAVTMRRVATHLDTGASALYVYIRSRDDLLDAMFDHAMAGLAGAAFPPRERTWRQRLTWLLLEAVAAASGHGGLARVALATVPSGPNAIVITARVRDLLAEGGLDAATVPAALDLLALFVTAAALDRVPAASGQADQHRERLRWEIDVILNGLAVTPTGRVP
jgi:AcrR family transcriptional regulator